jgi:hypothetical protein
MAGKRDAPDEFTGLVAEFRRQYQTAHEFAKSDDAELRHRAYVMHRNLDAMRKLAGLLDIAY